MCLYHIGSCTLFVSNMNIAFRHDVVDSKNVDLFHNELCMNDIDEDVPFSIFLDHRSLVSSIQLLL